VAKQKKSEKLVVVVAVKGVCVCVLEVLPGVQRNHMGWWALQSVHVLGVLWNDHWEESTADTIVCVRVCSAMQCYHLATLTVPLEGVGADEVWQNFKSGTYHCNYPNPCDSPA
jgi:hypothetical protein